MIITSNGKCIQMDWMHWFKTGNEVFFYIGGTYFTSDCLGFSFVKNDAGHFRVNIFKCILTVTVYPSYLQLQVFYNIYEYAIWTKLAIRSLNTIWYKHNSK